MPRTSGSLTRSLCRAAAGDTGGVREIGTDQLLASASDPFVRHQVDPATTTRAWVGGDAVVVESTRVRPGEQSAGPILTCLGPAVDLDRLLAQLSTVTDPPWRLSVEHTSYAAVPTSWRQRETRAWHWMTTRDCPAPELSVDEVDDPALVESVLDRANPGSFARPGTPGIESWLGVRDGAELVSVGALVRQADRTGHLRGISVLPTHTGRGIGRGLSAALTQRALQGGSGVATLGVFTDNAPALAIYHRLGYAVVHTFVSGPVSG